MQSDQSTVGSRIHEALRDAGFPTLSSFARALDIEVSQLWKYVNDKRVPGPQRLSRIADLTGRSMYWLTTGRHPSPPLDDAVPPDEPDEGAPGEVGAAPRAGAGHPDVGGVGGVAASTAEDVGQEAHRQTMPVDGATREVA